MTTADILLQGGLSTTALQALSSAAPRLAACPLEANNCLKPLCFILVMICWRLHSA